MKKKLYPQPREKLRHVSSIKEKPSPYLEEAVDLGKARPGRSQGGMVPKSGEGSSV